MPNISLIAAIDDRSGIAKAGKIPWDLPGDRKSFRARIDAGPVVMGMNTFTANNFQPFGPGRNIVITRYLDERLQNIEVANDAKQFFENLKEDVWVVGGGQIFTESLPYATQLYLTRVEGDFGCDVFFPEFENNFILMHQGPAQAENGINFTYQIWQKM